MMSYQVKGISFFVFTATAFGCTKPYNPPAIAAPNSYLAVEGVINSGTDSTTIKISRTVNLSSRNATKPETGAIVAVEGSRNTSYPLKEIVKGTYASAGLNLDNSQNYRLTIKTSAGGQYASNFAPVLNSPAIDSVSFTANTSNVNIYVSTHDPNNIVKYYRWDYQETYLFHPEYFSGYIATNDTILSRFGNGPDIYDCWRSSNSSSIFLGSTAKLSSATIINNLIRPLAANDEELRFGYSINIRQYALTADAFAFWQNLKTNTEQLGSIFDAQPSQINGNLHCVTNAAEPVIGYISVGNVVSKRIFITPFQLPPVNHIDSYAGCALDTFYYKPSKGQLLVSELYLVNGFNAYVVVSQQVAPFIGVSGYTATLDECGDCKLRGTNIKPSFWK